MESEEYDELAKQLENASPLEIMDKALEKFGKEIAIAFRYVFKFETFHCQWIRYAIIKIRQMACTFEI